jgi:hypothetical protein
MRTMSEMTIAELERIAAVDNGADYRAQRQEDADAMRLCDELEEHDAERAADDLELLAHKDDFGRPLPGFESPRYLDARQADYVKWLMSPAGERTRKNAHPELEARLRRAKAGR